MSDIHPIGTRLQFIPHEGNEFHAYLLDEYGEFGVVSHEGYLPAEDGKGALYILDMECGWASPIGYICLPADALHLAPPATEQEEADRLRRAAAPVVFIDEDGHVI